MFTLAFIFDCVFQYAVYKSISILPALTVAAILAVLPYLFFRGLINRFKSKG